MDRPDVESANLSPAGLAINVISCVGGGCASGVATGQRKIELHLNSAFIDDFFSMLTKPIPRWILVGGFLLAAMGGSINAVGLLCVQGHPLSHMSGTVTSLGIEVAQRHSGLASRAALVLISFFVGSMMSGMIIRQSTLKAGRRYGATLMIESALLILAAHLLRHDAALGLYIAAMACGLQNGMATSYSGAVIRTTHVTGIVTDLGIAIGHTARGLKADWRRMRLYLVLLMGFLPGALLGTFGFREFNSDTLLIPAGFAGLTGFGYTVWKQFWSATKHTAAHSRPPLPAPKAASENSV